MVTNRLGLHILDDSVQLFEQLVLDLLVAGQFVLEILTVKSQIRSVYAQDRFRWRRATNISKTLKGSTELLLGLSLESTTGESSKSLLALLLLGVKIQRSGLQNRKKG